MSSLISQWNFFIKLLQVVCDAHKRYWWSTKTAGRRSFGSILLGQIVFWRMTILSGFSVFAVCNDSKLGLQFLSKLRVIPAPEIMCAIACSLRSLLDDIRSNALEVVCLANLEKSLKSFDWAVFICIVIGY